MLKIKRKKAGITLMELVIVMAVTAIVLAELTTFIIYSTTQSNRLTEQNECYTALMNMKKLISNEFYDLDSSQYQVYYREIENENTGEISHYYYYSDNASNTELELFKGLFWKERATYLKELSDSFDYSEKITKIEIEEIKDDLDNGTGNFVCEMTYVVKEGDDERVFSFILNKEEIDYHSNILKSLEGIIISDYNALKNNDFSSYFDEVNNEYILGETSYSTIEDFKRTYWQQRGDYWKDYFNSLGYNLTFDSVEYNLDTEECKITYRIKPNDETPYTYEFNLSST